LPLESKGDVIRKIECDLHDYLRSLTECR
jgi:hypothetical protein